MFSGDLSVNPQPIFMKFSKDYYRISLPNTVKFSLTNIVYCNILLFRMKLIFAHFAQGLCAQLYIPAKYCLPLVFRKLWDWVLKGVTAV